MLFAIYSAAGQDAASSAPPPSVTEVMNYFEVMGIRGQMQTLLEAERKQLRVSFSDMFDKTLPAASAKEREQFLSLMDGAMNDLFSDYPIEDILRDMVPIYQKHLSEADLNAIVSFYSSPVGKKVLKEMPAMTSEAMRISFARFQPKIELMMKNMQSRIEEMAKSEKAGKGGTGTAVGKPASQTPRQ